MTSITVRFGEGAAGREPLPRSGAARLLRALAALLVGLVARLAGGGVVGRLLGCAALLPVPGRAAWARGGPVAWVLLRAVCGSGAGDTVAVAVATATAVGVGVGVGVGAISA